MNLTTIPTDLSAASGSTSHAPAKPSKIHDAAQQFESLMINEMLKSVKESSSSGWLGSDGDSASESATDMAQAQFATALAKSGGLGLTKMIETNLSSRPVHRS